MALQPVPVSDEQAKAIQETAKLGAKGLDVVKDVGGYISKIFGTLPENLVGLLGADWVLFKRFENLAKLTKRARAILDELKVTETKEVPFTIGLPLLHAAADENREELIELWARLLAAAMDPERSQFVRHSFVELVRRMDPLDARILDHLEDGPDMHPNAIQFIAGRFGVGTDAVEVSIDHLEELGLTKWRPDTNQQRLPLSPKGRELKRALPRQS